MKHRKQKSIIYYREIKASAWGGVDKIAQHSYIKPTVPKHLTLFQLSDGNPVAPKLMIFGFLPEECVATSTWGVMKVKRTAVNIKNEAVLFHRSFWHFGDVRFNRSQIITREEDALGRNRGWQQSIQTQLPFHLPAILNNASSFP